VTFALEILTLLVGGVIMLALVPRCPVRVRRRRSGRTPIRAADLERLEALVVTAGVSQASTHAYLRPLLREIASARLNRTGTRLDGDPDTARELLGDELWEIVRHGRPRPADAHGRGLSLEQLAGMTDRLERL
jgi:hypothetical protein